MMITRNFNINSKLNNKPLCLTIGNFDGVHIGHKFILNKLIEDSKKNKLQSSVLSFHPHPRKFFDSNSNNFNIITDMQKKELLDQEGIDIFYILKFDKNVSSMSPMDFVKNFLINKLNVKSLTIGENFRFGKDRVGDINLLKEISMRFNFVLNIVDFAKLSKTNEVFSSTLIRQKIMSGEVNILKKFLGRKWAIKGIVEKGDKIARKMNFPTANIHLKDIIHPKKGVYAVKIILNNKNYVGVANFGRRPTFGGKKVLLEVNIFDFNNEIYGKELTIEFLTFIREEIKFKSFNTLKEQVNKDVHLVKSYLKKIKI